MLNINLRKEAAGSYICTDPHLPIEWQIRKSHRVWIAESVYRGEEQALHGGSMHVTVSMLMWHLENREIREHEEVTVRLTDTSVVTVKVGSLVSTHDGEVYEVSRIQSVNYGAHLMAPLYHVSDGNGKTDVLSYRDVVAVA